MPLKILLFLLLTSLSSCFTRWVMSEKEIRQHYANMPVKPVFTTIKTDSVLLFCASTGSDTLPPLLLVHGAPGGWFTNISLLDDPQLQQSYHIIAVDRPGYGKSKFRKKKMAQTSIELQASAIHHAMQLNRSGRKGVVYGNSYGAPIALKIAASHPGEFNHLVLAAGALDPDNEKFWWFHRYAGGLFVRLAMPRFINTATNEKFAHVEELKKLSADWSRLSMPVTVIQGTADYIVPVENFDFARRQLQNHQAQFILIEGAGHLIRRSHPEVIKDVLLKAR
jgi:pimeloyl-ACP methyl ester carboxylesterase